MLFFLLSIAAGLLLRSTGAANVLLNPINTPSHIIFFSQLGSEISRRGHNVSMIYGSSVTVPKDLNIDANITQLTYHMAEPSFGANPDEANYLLDILFNGTIWRKLFAMHETLNRHSNFIEHECEHLLNDTVVMNQLRDTQYDMVIVDFFHCHAILPYKLSLPFAMFGVPHDHWLYKVAVNPSYIPMFNNPAVGQMTFLQRTLNCLYYAASMFIIPTERRDLVKRYVPEKASVAYSELMSRASLVYSLQDDVLSYIKPQMPNVLNVAAIMGRPSKSLPNDIQKFLDNAKEGVILVSFGSWLNFFPEDIFMKLVSAFSKLNQHVIWRIPDRFKSVEFPKNIHVVSWMPQNDILAHPNLVLFVTHCGYNSLIESLYHGVPVVGLPIGLDQFNNAAVMMNNGYGLALDFRTFTSDGLASTITSVLNDKSVMRSVSRASDTLKNPAQPVGDKVTWLMEQVIKYGDTHLKSPAHRLTWYQYHGLDVIVFLLTILLVTVYLVLFLCGKLVRSCLTISKVKTS